MAVSPRPGRPQACPSWCVMRHGVHSGEEDLLHVGGVLLVRRSLLRLCATTNPDTGARDGPFVLFDSAEFTLHEAEALIAALTQLVDQGRESLLPQEPEGALPILDP